MAAGVLVLVLASGMFVAAPAWSATIAIAPQSLVSTTGVTGSGQTATNLAVKDQTGSQDNWAKYVEFTPSGGSPYSGYRAYALSSAVSPASVTGIQLTINYRGPSTASQTSTWALYNWAASTWTNVGTNATAPDWGSWKTLTFASPTTAAAFVSSAGAIRVRMNSSNASDSVNLDYESLSVTSSAGGTAITLPVANAQFDYQIGGPYTPVSAVGVVSRDRLVAPAAGKYNICYVNLMQTQPDEPGQSTTNPPYGTTQWWKNNHFSALLPDESTADPNDVVIDAEWNEVVFDLRTTAKRTALFTIQKPWLQGCKDAGYSAIEPDNLDTYTRSTNAAGTRMMTFGDNVSYLKLVVPWAHSIGLAVAQKNVNEEFANWQVATGRNGRNFVDTVSPAQGFDFAIAEECQVWEECGQYTAVYGNLVYEIEYTNNNPLQNRSGIEKTAYAWACQDRGATMSVILRDVNVTASGSSTYHYQSC